MTTVINAVRKCLDKLEDPAFQRPEFRPQVDEIRKHLESALAHAEKQHGQRIDQLCEKLFRS